MKIKKTPEEIWKEYQNAVTYNAGVGLYENVERNNNFFNDKQWEGVNAPDLDKPVFNFLKPVVSYYIAMLVSDDIAASIELTGNTAPESIQAEMDEPGADDSERVPKIIAQEIDNIIERTNMKFKNRRMIRNCAVDGDGCFYVWFDPDAETGFDYKGEIKIDLLDNTNVMFGNPTDTEVQEQPYILLAYRRLTEDVKDEARANGLSAEGILPDSECRYMNSEKDSDNDYTTVILKMWKEKGIVHIMKCTEKAVIKKETDTEYKLYPLAWMSWESVKNSYHGVSPITGKIPNQIFVNKIYAMAQMQAQNFAFPKVVYDKTKIPNWSNKVGQAIAAAGDPSTAVFSGFKAPDMSGDVLNMGEMTIRQTKEMMGASDAALGNVKPDNTSAIIAVQKAAGLPLDIQRMDFYNFVESCVRIFIEIMRVNYGMRSVSYTNSEGNRVQSEFDFSALEKYALNLKIDIGQGSYWSELMQVQTLDNLMQSKVIPDALTYLEAIPEGYIKNKNKIIERIREQQAVMEAGMPGAENSMPDETTPMGGMEEVPMGMPEEMLMGMDEADVALEEPIQEADGQVLEANEEIDAFDIASALLEIDPQEVEDILEGINIPEEDKMMIFSLYEQEMNDRQ